MVCFWSRRLYRHHYRVSFFSLSWPQSNNSKMRNLSNAVSLKQDPSWSLTCLGKGLTNNRVCFEKFLFYRYIHNTEEKMYFTQKTGDCAGTVGGIISKCQLLTVEQIGCIIVICHVCSSKTYSDSILAIDSISEHKHNIIYQIILISRNNNAVELYLQLAYS